MKKISFLDALPVINEEIAKRRTRWSLTIISWIDFDDVSQIIRIHLNKKWHLYNQSRPLVPWVNRVISSQIKNVVRNIYGNYSRPCLGCSANEGNDLCSIYVKQCEDCPLFAKWAKTKKHAHDSKLPVSLENHSQEVYDKPFQDVNLELIIPKLHAKMREKLKPIEWQVYRLRYIENKEDEQIAKTLGYKTTEKNRPNGYKRISNINKIIIAKARQILSDGEVEGL
jgi:hypothetical protein